MKKRSRKASWVSAQRRRMLFSLTRISSTETLMDGWEIMCCYEGGKNTLHKFYRLLYMNVPLASLKGSLPLWC